jgi:hypothetical protein
VLKVFKVLKMWGRGYVSTLARSKTAKKSKGSREGIADVV